MDIQETERPLAGAVVYVVYYYDGYEASPPSAVFDSQLAAELYIADFEEYSKHYTWEAYAIR
jgi:hypothetical protein